jgi:hopanoid biosynthesis associated protein HpnK
VNEAVIRAFTEGVLTSCSLMVTGEGFEHAVSLAHAHPDLAVGIHLVTVMGRAVLPPATIPTLVDATGHFGSNPTRAGLQYYFSPQARSELRQELRAQFDKFAATGLRLSHIDGHLHMHVHPVIFRAALELGVRYGVRRMRVPQEEYRLAANFKRQDAGKKALHTLLFGLLARRMKRQLRRSDFVYTERVYGTLYSGQMDEQYFLYMLDNLHAKTNEIYFHPVLFPANYMLNTAEQQGMQEFAALTSPSVCRRAQELGIELMSYFDLEESR